MTGSGAGLCTAGSLTPSVALNAEKIPARRTDLDGVTVSSSGVTAAAGKAAADRVASVSSSSSLEAVVEKPTKTVGVAGSCTGAMGGRAATGGCIQPNSGCASAVPGLDSGTDVDSDPLP